MLATHMPVDQRPDFFRAIGDPLVAEMISSTSRRHWILFSNQPDAIRNELAIPIAARINAKREDPLKDFGPGSPSPGDHEMPPFTFWLDGLEEWRRKKKLALLQKQKEEELKVPTPGPEKPPEKPPEGEAEALGPQRPEPAPSSPKRAADPVPNGRPAQPIKESHRLKKGPVAPGKSDAPEIM
jgi:hypothetical protein